MERFIILMVAGGLVMLAGLWLRVVAGGGSWWIPSLSL